jgi:hypothetical protein
MDKFFAEQAKKAEQAQTKQPHPPNDGQAFDDTDTTPKQLPKGVVLGKDGKP